MMKTASNASLWKETRGGKPRHPGKRRSIQELRSAEGILWWSLFSLVGWACFLWISR